MDWYAATLFRQEPVLTFEGPNEAGKKFYEELVEDADRKGTHLNDFFRRQFTECLITGGSYVLVDFPRAASAGRDASRGRCNRRVACVPGGLCGRRPYQLEPRRAGQLRMGGDPDPDAEEGLAWRIRNGCMETRWSYYDKQTFRIYVSTQDTGLESAAVLVDEGYARAGEAGTSSAVRAADAGRAVDAEPRGIAATGALQ